MENFIFRAVSEKTRVVGIQNLFIYYPANVLSLLYIIFK